MQSIKHSPVIIVPAFRRPKALHRLLHSINNAHYPESDVHLLISLDGGASEEVVGLAKSFYFDSGTVDVVEHRENLGLRNHILWCGDQTEKYGSVIVLEEDLVVDPYFYLYTIGALNYYQDHAGIGGIALYSPAFNEFADLPFIPLRTEWDTFFMQTGCSSGQAWNRLQWAEFRKWHDLTSVEDLKMNAALPDVIRFLWAESSWKKYYSGWLVSSQRYMVYPYECYSTNFSDPDGAHLKKRNNLHQGVLSDPGRKRGDFQFANPDGRAVWYDSFMEMAGDTVKSLLNMDPDSVEIDLHGIKSIERIKNKTWVITPKPVRNTHGGYPLMVRPIEMNLLYQNEDEDDVFFHLAKSEDVLANRRLDSKKYFELARYYIHFSPFKTRFFVRYLPGYIRELMKHLTGR